MAEEQQILDDLAKGHYRVTHHGRQRMSERHITDHDIRCCAVDGSISQQSDGKFKVRGSDLDGDQITVICAYDGETLIVTAY